MTAGAEVVCNDVVRKVEIEERCVAGFDTSDLNEVGADATVDANVGGNGNGNVGGDGKDDADDSSYVFVSGSVEVSAGDPADTGGVNVDDCAPKSDSNEVDQFKKEELGIEQGEIPVDPLVLDANGIVNGSATASDAEVNAVTDDVILENGSTVDPHVVLESNVIVLEGNGHLDKVAEEGAVLKCAEDGAVVKSTEEGDDANGNTNVGAEIDDIVSEVTLVPKFTLHTIESSQVTGFESEYIIKPSEESNSQVSSTCSQSTPDIINRTEELPFTPYIDRNTDCEVVINDGPESMSTLIDKADYQITVPESGKPSEHFGCQVTVDGSEYSVCPFEERKGQVEVDESGKPSEDLGRQVKVDEPKSCGSPNKEREHEVSVDGPGSFSSLADNHECLVSVDELESSGDHTKEVKANAIVMESAEHQELLVISSEVNVEAEGTEIGSGTESEENPDSGLVLPEDADALAKGQVEKSDGILLWGETQISQTEADGSVLLLLNAEIAKSEEKLEKPVEESSETIVKIIQTVETKSNSEEEVKTQDEIQESQSVVIDNVQDDLNLEDNTAESAKEAGVPLETETNIEPITVENTASQHEVSNCVDKPLEGFQSVESAENVQTIDQVKSECNNSELLVEKDNDLLSNPDDLTVVEQKVEIVPHLGTENNEDMSCGTGSEKLDVSDDEEKETEVKGAPVESLSHLVTAERSAESMDCGSGDENVNLPGDEVKETEANDVPVEPASNLVTDSTFDKVMDCGTRVEPVVVPDDEEKETEVKDAPVGDHSTVSFPDTIVNRGAVIEFGSIGRQEATPAIRNDEFISVPATDSDSPERNIDGSHGDRNGDKVSSPEVEDMDGIQNDEIPTSSVEGSVSDAIDAQNDEAEVLAYNFLIRIPRFEDENFRDQIRGAQLLVDEKTRIRDAIRAEIHEKRAKLKAHNEAYNAAKMEETAARRLVRLKRQEIDSVQVVINRWKNAMSVEEIDRRIINMEHMIQHETLQLKDEKQFIREIKQHKSLRDQLALNMGSQEEIRQAIDQKDDNEERMKTLRKELDSLKDKVSKAEAVVKAVGKRYDEESRKERELQAQFRSADDVRQKAYAHLNSLKKLSYDKNENFRLYKEDLMAARDFASRGDKDALHRLCANQVESFMEQWNNNDEFRKEYVNRCNMNAIRRQRALDAGSLVPDDVAPVLPNSNVNENVDRSLVSIPTEVTSVSVVSDVEKGKKASSTEGKHGDDNSNTINNSIENITSQKKPTLKTKTLAKPTTMGVDNEMETEEIKNRKEEETTLTKEDIELARKAEELKKEEAAAKLKEQRRSEEKAKANEALERKKRNAEKARVRAELRAHKEAELKEKEREKRLRKKEKKAGGGDNGEEAVGMESLNEVATKENESVVVNKKKTQKPPAHFFSKQLKPKPIPPPLVNRNKKRWQQWGKIALAIVAIFAVFLLGNGTFYTNIKVFKNVPF